MQPPELSRHTEPKKKTQSNPSNCRVIVPLTAAAATSLSIRVNLGNCQFDTARYALFTFHTLLCSSHVEVVNPIVLRSRCLQPKLDLASDDHRSRSPPLPPSSRSCGHLVASCDQNLSVGLLRWNDEKVKFWTCNLGLFKSGGQRSIRKWGF